MLFGSAKLYRIRFGKYAGKTLDEIATTTAGLLWLDWLRGEMEGKGEKQHPETWDALTSYLDNDTIAAELTAAQRRRDR